MPIQFHQGLAIVEVRIEGLDRLARLAIDSGAVTAISRDLASELAFDVDRSVASPFVEDGMKRAVDAEPILLRHLSVGKHTFQHVPAVLIAPDVFRVACVPIDGVLGTGGLSSAPGFLEQVAVEINRDLRRVRLARDGSLLGEEGDITLPLRRYLVDENGEKIDDASTWIPVLLEGQFLWAVLDTGGAGPSTMTRDVFSFIGRSVDDEDVRHYLGHDGMYAGGPSDTNLIAEVRDVQLGRFRFDTRPFSIMEPRKDGIPMVVLNQNLLEHFNIVLDYQASEVRVSLAESRPATDERPLELAWHILEGRVVILGMLADGAAQQAGIEVGDEVVKVNDAEVSGEDQQAICDERMRWHASQNPLRLTLRRNGHEFDVTLPRMEPRPGRVVP